MKDHTQGAATAQETKPKALLCSAQSTGFEVRLGRSRGQERGEPWKYRSLPFRGSPSVWSTEDEAVEEAAGALRLVLHHFRSFQDTRHSVEEAS